MTIPEQFKVSDEAEMFLKRVSGASSAYFGFVMGNSAYRRA